MAEKTLRDAIADHLIAHCTSFNGFYQPGLANKSTTRPFGVIRIGPQREDEQGIGIITTVQIAVHTDNLDDLNVLDALVKQVRDEMDEVDVACGNSLWVTPHFTGVTSEYPDDDRGTVMRLMEFEVVTAR